MWNSTIGVGTPNRSIIYYSEAGPVTTMYVDRARVVRCPSIWFDPRQNRSNISYRVNQSSLNYPIASKCDVVSGAGRGFGPGNVGNFNIALIVQTF